MEIKIKKNKDLLEDLCKVYEGVREGTMGLNQAKQAANVAGKIVGSAKTQLEYNKWSKNDKPIEFLEC